MQENPDRQMTSLLHKYLTAGVRERLQRKKTKFGGDLNMCIKSGEEAPESKVGVYATDADAYSVFEEMFIPIIADVHKVPRATFIHPAPSFTDYENSDINLSECDPDNNILSTRVRVVRNLNGYAFSSFISHENRLDLANRVQRALEALPPQLQGKFRYLKDIPEAEQNELVMNHILYRKEDKFLEAAGCYRDWPSGRGIFISTNERFIIWVNEEDHLRIISMAPGSDLHAVYSLLIQALDALKEALDFAYDPRLGNLSTCPTNLGTSLRASVLVRLPRLASLANFKNICATMDLDVRGTHGEQTDAEGGVYDISNKQRMGITESQALRKMVYGVKVLLLIEQSL